MLSFLFFVAYVILVCFLCHFCIRDTQRATQVSAILAPLSFLAVLFLFAPDPLILLFLPMVIIKAFGVGAVLAFAFGWLVRRVNAVRSKNPPGKKGRDGDSGNHNEPSWK